MERHETGRVGVGDSYDIDAWQSWLSTHRLDIKSIRSIVFYSDDSMTVHQYAHDDTGSPFVDTYGNIVMQQPVNVLVESAPPTWVHNKDDVYR